MAIRIYDISKRLGLECCDVLSIARQLVIDEAKVPSSSLDETAAALLEEACLKRYGSYHERNLRHAAAAKAYQNAADQGDADAQFNLGVCYDKGEGVHQDDAEALRWICKAAEQGHANAFKLLVRKADEEEKWRKALPELVKKLGLDRKPYKRGESATQLN